MKPEKENKQKQQQQQQTSNKIITQGYQSRCCSSCKPSIKATFSTFLDNKRGEHDAIRNLIYNDLDKHGISQPKTQQTNQTWRTEESWKQVYFILYIQWKIDN